MYVVIYKLIIKSTVKIKIFVYLKSLNTFFSFLEFFLHYQIAAYFLAPCDEFCQNKINI